MQETHFSPKPVHMFGSTSEDTAIDQSIENSPPGEVLRCGEKFVTQEVRLRGDKACKAI